MGDAPLLRLASCHVVVVQGPEARAFLHAQTMNDVAALKPGEWQWNGLLNPKGRLLFLFRLVCRGDSEFWLVQSVPRGAALAAHLQTYRFRARVTILVPNDRFVFGAVNPVPLDPPRTARFAEDGSLSVSLAPRRAAHLVISDDRPTPGASEEEWWREELLAGVVRVHEALAGRYLPSMLGLDHLGAFSLRKGCYPGQEILARSHYLGEVKRHLVILRGRSRLAPGERLEDAAGRAIGEVVDAAGAVHDRVLACVTSLAMPMSSLATAEGPLLVHQPLDQPCEA